MTVQADAYMDAVRVRNCPPGELMNAALCRIMIVVQEEHLFLQRRDKRSLKRNIDVLDKKNG